MNNDYTLHFISFHFTELRSSFHFIYEVYYESIKREPKILHFISTGREMSFSQKEAVREGALSVQERGT